MWYRPPEILLGSEKVIALDIAAKPLEMQESMESCSTFVFDVDSDMLLRNFQRGKWFQKHVTERMEKNTR